jgi:hypothetical protein
VIVNLFQGTGRKGFGGAPSGALLLLAAAAAVCLALQFSGCGRGQSTVVNPESNRTGLWSLPDTAVVADPAHMKNRIWQAQISTLSSTHLFLAQTDTVQTVVYLRFGTLPDTTGMEGARIGLRFTGADNSGTSQGTGQILQAAVVDSSADDWSVDSDRLVWDNKPALLDPLDTGTVLYAATPDTSWALIDNIVRIPTWWIEYWKKHPEKNRGLAVWLADVGGRGAFRVLSREAILSDSTTVINPVLTVFQGSTVLGQVAPSQDAYVYHDSRPIPADQHLLWISDWPPTRALFGFDLPLGAGLINEHTTINRAVLRLHYAPATLPSNLSIVISAYRVGDPWDSGTTAPIDSVGARYTQLTVPAAADTVEHTVSFDLAPLFQLWIDGKDPNYGVVLRSNGDGVGLSRIQVYGRDAEAALRPRLELVYSQPPGARWP